MTSTASILDQIPDIDGHEMVPTHLWGEEFGPAAGRIAELSYPYLMMMKGGNDFHNPDFRGDIAEITLETVWNVRGTDAPASTDFTRRIEVMDLMGVRRQLVFPSYALFALKLLNGDEHLYRNLFQTDLPVTELRELGRAGLAAACLLMTKGADAATAVAKLSAARGVGIPETPEQRSWITAFALRLV